MLIENPQPFFFMEQVDTQGLHVEPTARKYPVCISKHTDIQTIYVVVCVAIF